MKVCTVTLLCVVFLFIQSTLSAPFKTYTEIDYSPHIRHRVINAPPKCDCHSEDFYLPEVTFYNLESSDDELIKRILHLSQIHGDNIPTKRQRNKKVPALDDTNRMSALDPRLLLQQRNENNDDTELPALDPRLKQDQNDANDLPALDPRLIEPFDETESPALDPRLTPDQSEVNSDEGGSNNSPSTNTDNINPQQEAPLDPSEIPSPDRAKVDQIRAMIDANSNNPNSVLSQGKFPKTKQQILDRVAAGRTVPRQLDDPATS